MSEVFHASFGPNIDETEVIKTENGAVEEITKYVGLNIAHKVYAFVGDGATNNNTMADHYLQRLLQKYDNDPQLNLGLPRYYFRGRDSRIYCQAHVNDLVVKSIYTSLRSGSREEADAIVNNVLNSDGVFPPYVTTLSYIIKVQSFILQVIKSKERRKWWTDLCLVFLPLDVNTRQNSLYLIIKTARAQKAKIVQYAQFHPTCKHLIPLESDQVLAEQVERTLWPFYERTLVVLKMRPNLDDYISRIWNIVDLLDEVSSRDRDFGDVGEDLRVAFDSAKETLKKWTD